MLTIGKPAPDFRLQADDGKTYSLADFKGKTVVLYFYPKDDTPGCTLESCGFGENIAKFTDKNTVILGVSRDSIASHQAFKKKYNLPFLLLSDPDSVVCNAYEVIGEKTNFGKKILGLIRSTFLIDPNGDLQHVWKNVQVAGHIDAVLKEIS